MLLLLADLIHQKTANQICVLLLTLPPDYTGEHRGVSPVNIVGLTPQCSKSKIARHPNRMPGGFVGA